LEELVVEVQPYLMSDTICWLVGMPGKRFSFGLPVTLAVGLHGG